jgi:hypothetical protein
MASCWKPSLPTPIRSLHAEVVSVAYDPGLVALSSIGLRASARHGCDSTLLLPHRLVQRNIG